MQIWGGLYEHTLEGASHMQRASLQKTKHILHEYHLYCTIVRLQQNLQICMDLFNGSMLLVKA